MLKLKPVEASVVDDQAVFCVALSRFRAHPQLWAQSEEDHVRDCQEEREQEVFFLLEPFYLSERNFLDVRLF